MERSVYEHFGHISREVLWTEKLRGFVLRDRTRQDKNKIETTQHEVSIERKLLERFVREFSQEVLQRPSLRP